MDLAWLGFWAAEGRVDVHNTQGEVPCEHMRSMRPTRVAVTGHI